MVEISEDGEMTAAVVIEEPVPTNGSGGSNGNGEMSACVLHSVLLRWLTLVTADSDGDTDEGEDSDSQEEDDEPPAIAEEPKKPSVTFKVLLRKGAKIQVCVCVCCWLDVSRVSLTVFLQQAKELDIPEDNPLAQKVRERQGEEEREREEMRGLVLQKARLISDSADDDETFKRLNKGGLNMKTRPKEEPKVAGPPVRQIGKKVRCTCVLGWLAH